MSINIQENIPLKKYTTFKIGGPAKYFVEVSDEEALLEALEYAKKNNLEFFILGGGSNVLVSDKGFDGLTIKLVQNAIYPKSGIDQSSAFPFPDKSGNSSKPSFSQNSRVECWAGDSLANLVNFAAENSLVGLEWAAGIPGTIGGAIRGNAGAFGATIADNIEKVKVIVIPIRQPAERNLIKKKLDPSTPLRSAQDDIKILELQNNDCKFSYRNSIFKQNKNIIIMSSALKLQKGNKGEIMAKIKEYIKKRSGKQPKEFSAGSFFQNPVVDNPKLIEEFEKKEGIKCKDEKLPAGWLIEQAGIKGKKIGGAMISEKHTNFIVNTGKATAEDVIMLVSLIKQQVRDKFAVELQEEVQYVGFD